MCGRFLFRTMRSFYALCLNSTIFILARLSRRCDHWQVGRAMNSWELIRQESTHFLFARTMHHVLKILYCRRQPYLLDIAMPAMNQDNFRLLLALREFASLLVGPW